MNLIEEIIFIEMAFIEDEFQVLTWSIDVDALEFSGLVATSLVGI